MTTMKSKYLGIRPSRITRLLNLFLKRLLVCCIYIALQNESSVDAADQVVTRNETLFGKIESVSIDSVQLLPRGSTRGVREIGVSDVVMIQFSDEPQDLIEAKRRLVKNNFVEVSAIHNDSGYRQIRSTLSNQYNLSNLEANIQILEADVNGDRSLTLRHVPYNDIPLAESKDEVLKHLHYLWQFDVKLTQLNDKGDDIEIARCPAKAVSDTTNG